MTSEDACDQNASPQILIHSFETTAGTARPTKSNELGLLPALSTRRAHKKSRAGCARCKSRRIKCDEQKPTCSNCLRGGFSCVYPHGSRPSKPSQTPSSNDSIMAFPSTTSDTFTLQDMRFFHHFLIKAKPYLPVGNETVWAREIPQFAQQNTFLMHASLALGSSHLGRLVENDSFRVQALTYRVKGLDGLRKAMAKQFWNYGDADSMIAAGYNLMLQSAHMEDGLYDWISLMRLVSSVSRRILENQAVSTEFDLRPMKHFENIAPYLHLLPTIDPELLSSGLTALEELRPRLTNSVTKAFQQILKDCLRAHQSTPQQGYMTFGKTFEFWIELPDEQFATCMSPLNGEMQLLLLYFISIFLMTLPLGVIENYEAAEWSSTRHVMGVLGWAHHTLQNVPRQLREHTQFPETVVTTVTAEMNAMPFSGPSVLQLDAAGDLVQRCQALRLAKQNPETSSLSQSATSNGPTSSHSAKS